MIQLCQDSPFSILCDEGNKGYDKNFAILVHMWDDGQGKPVTWFFDMPKKVTLVLPKIFSSTLIKLWPTKVFLGQMLLALSLIQLAQ